MNTCWSVPESIESLARVVTDSVIGESTPKGGRRAVVGERGSMTIGLGGVLDLATGPIIFAYEWSSLVISYLDGALCFSGLSKL